MNQTEVVESGYMTDLSSGYGLEPYFTEVEILRITPYNIVGRGKRYGRWWLLKGLPPEKTHSVVLRRRLNKEFEIHSRLHHAAIPMAVAIEEVEGLGPCVVMEWVEGMSLEKTLDSRTLSRGERREILLKIVEVVAYVHSSGIAHRDLKPSNIMLRKTGGEVALIDFGLADTDYYAELKQPAGTPGFISPEQREEGGTDASDDVFSIGVLMRLLCPEFKRLGKRCTAPRERRLADAGDVLRHLKRRIARPKKILYSSLAIILAAVLTTAGRVYNTSRFSEKDRERMTTILTENREIKAKAAQLEDSLRRAAGRQLDAERKQAEAENRIGEIERYNAMRQTILNRAMTDVKRIITRREKGIALLTEGDNEKYSEEYKSLNSDYERWMEEFRMEVRRSALSDEDKDLMISQMTNYYFVELDKYVQKCLKRIYPQHS